MHVCVCVCVCVCARACVCVWCFVDMYSIVLHVQPYSLELAASAFMSIKFLCIPGNFFILF